MFSGYRNFGAANSYKEKQSGDKNSPLIILALRETLPSD